MPVLFKNPDLTDYFVVRDEVRRDRLEDIRPVTEDYEAGKVIALPNLKFDIDFAFWASLPSETYPVLKKLPSSAIAGDLDNDRVLDRKLELAGLPPELEQALRRQIRALYVQVLPVYERLFADYRFTRRQVVWRLNTIRNENMHVDTYNQLFPDHFARMFINLDDQPRIWNTSYTADEICQRYGAQVEAEVLRDGDGGEMFIALNRAAFGGRSSIWWDNQPRHVAYFDPGDVWLVDSRQVAHQIFYGRRAVSFDFFVDPASMRRPDRQYLALAEDFRRRALALAGPGA